MRSDAGESSGKKRSSQVVARWLSVKSVAARLDFSVRTVVRMEANGDFGAGNSSCTKGGDLRIRAVAVNRLMEEGVQRRELMRQANSERMKRARLFRLERDRRPFLESRAFLAGCPDDRTSNGEGGVAHG